MAASQNDSDECCNESSARTDPRTMQQNAVSERPQVTTSFSQSFIPDLAKKRLSLVGTTLNAYIDTILDSLNAYQLYIQGHYWWASLTIFFIISPGIITWVFLRVNGMATLSQLPSVALLAAPAFGLYGSWETGEASQELLWYTAAEGLGEAPLTGILTCYIVSLLHGATWTFYLSILSSFFTMSKTAMTINFYGQHPELYEQVIEVLERLPAVALRISSLAAYAVLMRPLDHVNPHHGRMHSTQSAIFAWMLFSFMINAAMIHVLQPRCPKSVMFYFACLMVFSEPLRCVTAFGRMSFPYKALRLGELVAMFITCVQPLDPTPNLHTFLKHSRFLIGVLCVSLPCLLLVYITKTCQVPTSAPSGFGLLGSEDASDEEAEAASLDFRAKKVKERLYAALRNRDTILVNLFVSLDNASLNDPAVRFWVEAAFDSATVEAWKAQGLMPPGSCDFDRKKIAKELKDAEFAARQLKDVGFDAMELTQAGFTAKQVSGAGFTLKQLKDGEVHVRELKDAGYTSSMLKDVDFNVQELKDGGFNARDLHRAGFNVTKLQGVFSVQELKEGGISPQEFKAADSNVRELKDVGFTARELKGGGFNATELRNAGFNAQELNDGGFNAMQLKFAGFNATELRGANFNAQELKDEGFSAMELKDAGFNAYIMRSVGFNAGKLRDIGFSAQEMKDAGFKAHELIAMGFMALELKGVGFSIEELKDGGCTTRELKDAGFNAQKLLNVGFNMQELKDGGFNLQELIDAGSDVHALKSVGLNARKLNGSGLKALELIKAGFTAQELKDGGFNARELHRAGFNVTKLQGAFSVQELKEGGISPQEFKAADSNVRELKDVGFTAKELKGGGFNATELRGAGFNAPELKDEGFSAMQLEGAGFSAHELIRAGFNAQELRGVGFSASALKSFNLRELRAAGFTARQLTVAGFNAKELEDEAFTLRELIDGPFSAKQLRDAGFTAQEFKNGGLLAQLVSAGFTAQELREAELSVQDLASIGPRDLRAAGFNATDLKAAFSVKELLRDPKLDPLELEDAGFSNAELEKVGVRKVVIQNKNTNVGMKMGHFGTLPHEKEIPEGAIRITAIDSTGAIPEWNQKAPAKKRLELFDYIFDVNGVRPHEPSFSEEFGKASLVIRFIKSADRY